MEKLKALSVDLTWEVLEGRKESLLYVIKDDLFAEMRYNFSVPSTFVSFEWLQSEVLKVEELEVLVNEWSKNWSKEEQGQVVKIMERLMIEMDK